MPLGQEPLGAAPLAGEAVLVDGGTNLIAADLATASPQLAAGMLPPPAVGIVVGAPVIAAAALDTPHKTLFPANLTLRSPELQVSALPIPYSKAIIFPKSLDVI